MNAALPYRWLPPLGTLHAQVQPARLRWAAAAQAEAAGDPVRGALGRIGHAVAHDVLRGMAAATDNAFVGALDDLLGTTLPAPLAAAPLAQQRGLLPRPAPYTFGLPAFVTQTASAGVGQLLGALLAPLGADVAAQRGIYALGAAVAGGVACATALTTLAIKGVLLAAGATLGAALGGAKTLLRGVAPPAALPRLQVRPVLAEVLAADVADRLGKPDDDVDDRARLERAAGRLVATGRWRAVDAAGLPQANAARLAATLAPYCAAALADQPAPLGDAEALRCLLPASRALHWQQQLAALAEPAAVARLLGGVDVMVGDRPLGPSTLLAAADVTCAARPGPRTDRPALQLDVLLCWPAGCLLGGDSGAGVRLPAPLALALQLQLEAPCSAASLTPVVRVAEARWWAGSAAIAGA